MRLAGPAHAEIRRLAEAAYPHEGCGVLIGGHDADTVRVQEATSGRNLWTERLADRYDLDPADILAADVCARARGLDVVGFWHSHPDHPAWPSQFELRPGLGRLRVRHRHNGGRRAAADLNAFSPAGEGRGLREIVLSSRAGRREPVQRGQCAPGAPGGAGATSPWGR